MHAHYYYLNNTQIKKVLHIYIILHFQNKYNSNLFQENSWLKVASKKAECYDISDSDSDALHQNTA